jgi:ATP phosphoribosyltransferase regulatory subunit
MSETLSKIPAGMRYYSGPEARLRRSIEAAAISIFEGWSYEEITTPTIDYYSLFAHGMGRQQAHHAFRFSDRDGRLLAVRPDVTSLVARAAATLFAQRERPLRVCYAAPVFRQQTESHAAWRRETTQMGCELIGASSSIADLELLAIVFEVMQRLDLAGGCLITLNDVDIFNGIADELRLDLVARDEMRQLVDTRNSADLRRFLITYCPTREAASIAELIQLSGKRQLLDDARQTITNPRSSAALDRLFQLWSVIESLQLSDHFEIDLGDVSRLDYYTGLTFKIYISGAGSRVGSGGRYDGLTASFGKAEPAIGFVLELDALTDVLLGRQDTGAAASAIETSAPIAGRDPASLFRAAMDKRAHGERIVIDSREVSSCLS